tara:strand:+ start:20885 stop:22135 length:1251 start_codon:yes stop_codon:yes gene_type:complete
MKKLISLRCDYDNFLKITENIHLAFQKKYWVNLIAKEEQPFIFPEDILDNGPGIVIQTGGSTGGSKKCFHTIENLNQSAICTGLWLKEQGINPEDCIIFNPLPINHISGLMPWWRCKVWDAKHVKITKEIMKSPTKINEFYNDYFIEESRPKVISIVPTHLIRLISHRIGQKLLKSFDIIWVGGAKLNDSIAAEARELGLRLSPCYGATETASMVSALSPSEFLAGENNCGSPLPDVELGINENGLLKTKTSRLCIGKLINNNYETIRDQDGWWTSGDIARFEKNNGKKKLKILGRIDNVVNCGGETIFLDELENRFMKDAKISKLKVLNISFIPKQNKEWGQRIIGLVELEGNNYKFINKELLKKLNAIVSHWDSIEKPDKWFIYPSINSEHNKISRKRLQELIIKEQQANHGEN